MHTRIMAFSRSRICKRKRLFQTVWISSDFTFQKFWVQNDVVRRNDAEVQSIQAILAEQSTESFDGGSIIVVFPDVAVEVRKDEVDVLLRQSGKGTALDQDPPQIGMVVLDASLLPGSIGITIEYSGPPFPCDRADFDCGGI